MTIHKETDFYVLGPKKMRAINHMCVHKIPFLVSTENTHPCNALMTMRVLRPARQIVLK